MLAAPKARRTAEAAIVLVIALYLAYETGRYHLLGIPIPVLAVTLALSLLVAWAGVASREVQLRTARRAAMALGGTLVVCLSAWAIFHELDSAGLLPDWVVDDAARLVDAAHRVRVFDGSIFIVLAVAAAGLVGGSGIGIRWHGRTPGVTHALAVMALATMIVQDLVFFETMGLRDLRLDLRAGALFDHGQSPYMTRVVHVLPSDPTLLPFVYPPVTLPFFGTLADLPFPIVALAWTLGSLVATVVALRLIGLGWGWVGLLLLWPAVAQGMYVGNIALPAFLLFAAGPRLGAGLMLNGIAKVQGAIPALWLLRERRWSALIVGVLVLLALCLATLPVVGLASWSAWIAGLGLYQASAQFLPGLYGMGLPAIVPFPVYAALAVLAVVAALQARRLAGLARLGLASIIASPSLYSHGFLVGLAAFLRLRPFWFWVVMALTSTVLGPGWWLAVAIGVAGWYLLPLQRQPGSAGDLHPLAAGREPWLGTSVGTSSEPAGRVAI